MEVLGYSERGVINALFHEIRYRPDAEQLLSDLLDLFTFPVKKPARGPVSHAEVLIEQSLSDFGDPDVILLVDSGTQKFAFFLEAKIKPAQIRDWHIDAEFKRFVSGVQNRKPKAIRSNLFTQLYYKVRFAKALAQEGGLTNGVRFRQASVKRRRKIGENPIVLEAVKRIRPYIGQSFFVGVLPDRQERLERFFRDTLPAENLSDLPDEWDTSSWGFVPWRDIKYFCQDRMPNAWKVFLFNDPGVYLSVKR